MNDSEPPCSDRALMRRAHLPLANLSVATQGCLLVFAGVILGAAVGYWFVEKFLK